MGEERVGDSKTPWNDVLSGAASLRRRGEGHFSATILSGFLHAPTLFDLFRESIGINDVELPQMPAACEEPTDEIEAQLDGALRIAIDLAKKFKLQSDDEQLSCLLLVLLRQAPTEERERFIALPDPDDVWLRKMLRKCISELRPTESATRAGAIASVDTQQLLQQHEIPGYDMVPGAGEPLVLPTLDRNLQKISLALYRRRAHNLILLAPSGKGKTFAVEQLAARIKVGSVPSLLTGVPIIKLDLAGLQDAHVGATSKMLTRAFEVLGSLDRCIIFMDEFQGLVRGGPEGYRADVLSVLKDLLTSDRFPNLTIIAATTRHEYDVYVRTDRALERRFATIDIEYPEPEEEVDAVYVQGSPLFAEIDVQFTQGLARRALELASEYFPTLSAVPTALDLLDGTQARYRLGDAPAEPSTCLMLECQSRLSRRVLGRGDLTSVADLVAHFRERVVGQPHVIHQVVQTFQQSLLPIDDQHGPRGVFVFTGPSGVGKTHIARTYAEFLQKDGFVHLHMGDYSQGETAVVELMGAPPSYKRSEEGGVLANAIRSNPNCVLLLDEIDQADSSVWDLLYRILDEGVAIDKMGNPIDFRGCTIFMTTNQGNFQTGSGFGFSSADNTATAVSSLSRDEVLEGLQEVFNKAFLSRINVAVVFEALTKADLAQIATMKIRNQRESILEQTGLELEVSDELGNLFVLSCGAHNDARAVDSYLRESFWPRLKEILLRQQAEWQSLRRLCLLAQLPSGMRNLNVLLLDDEATQVKQELAALGPCIDVTASSDRRLSGHNWANCDAVLLDLDWGSGPEDGLEILKSLRETAENIPVLLHTNLSDHELRTTYFRNGATGFVPKGEVAVLEQALNRVRRSIVLNELANRGFSEPQWVTRKRAETLEITLRLKEQP